MIASSKGRTVRPRSILWCDLDRPTALEDYQLFICTYLTSVPLIGVDQRSTTFRAHYRLVNRSSLIASHCPILKVEGERNKGRVELSQGLSFCMISWLIPQVITNNPMFIQPI